MTKNFTSNKAPTPMGNYPHSKKVGNFLFLSGIGSRNSSDNSIPNTFEKECISVFKNIKNVIKESGAEWKNLIDVTVFLTNMEKDFNTFNKLYSDFFKDINPCRTTVEVKSLPSPISIELKCIAYVGDKIQ